MDVASANCWGSAVMGVLADELTAAPLDEPNDAMACVSCNAGSADASSFVVPLMELMGTDAPFDRRHRLNFALIHKAQPQHWKANRQTMCGH